MKKNDRIVLRCLITISMLTSLSFSMLSCATVPKEVVELSYRTGEDIAAVHDSYKKLIHDYFETLREQRIRYLEDEWNPKYIQEWVQDGRLRDIAKGDVVWSVENGDFIPPIKGKEEADLLSTINFWSITALQEIQNKRAELIDPLNKQEDQLTSLVDDAFDRLQRGNAAITANLNSLRKFQETQDSTLASLGLRDLREKINTTLATVSIKAKEELEAVKKADGLLQKNKKKLSK